MSQEFTSYVGTVHSSISGSSGDYLATSISLNFESDRVALSTSNVSNYTGRVEIHDYTAGYWVKNFTLSGPDGTNSSFGHEISLNWSGTRLAVSAYQKNKVYIYDATGTGSNKWSSYVSNTLNTSSLSLSSGDEFGYSISLAQDDGNRIAVGAPGENKVYVYEYDSANSNWGSGPVWSIGDTGMKNLVAKTVDTSGNATAYLHLHNVSNRFGHKVRLSAFGNYLIVGAPGTIATINSSSAYDPHTSTTAYSGTAYTNQRQIGNVRCFTNDTSTWASGTTQYGQSILGKAGTVVGDNNQPAFGTSCDISTNGNKISVSSPYKKVSTLGDAGQIDTYLINDDLDTWLSVSTSIAGSKSSQKLGMNLRLDFAGERLATGDLSTSNQESAYYGGISLYALDFGTDRWYDITPPIQVHNWPTVGSIDFNPLDITNGKIIAISDPRDPPGNSQSAAGNSGKVVFYQFPLTNAFQGNTSVGGYVKCENLYVGANDNSSNTDHSIPNKRISFGGTIKDNSYEETYIENRSVDGAGKSELLLYKRNDIWDKAGGNPHSTNAENMVDDSIRIKAAEICLDYEDTNLHGTYPNAATRNTRFLLNRGGQIAVGNAFYNGNFDVVSDFDVNDKSFFWTTVNIGNKTNKPLNTTPALNTNNERIFTGLPTSSTSIGKDGQQFERYNVNSQAWDQNEFAFYFSQSNATIYEDSHPGNWHDNVGQFSCWIKLNNTQYNCVGVLAWFGQDHHREEYTPGWTQYTGGLVKLTSSGLQFEYEYNSANVQTVSYTFNQDSWYHIGVNFPTENTYPGASSSYWPKIFIDGVEQTLSSYTGSAYTGSLGVDGFDDASYGFGSTFTYLRNGNGDIDTSNGTYTITSSKNNGIKNCWIALMDIGNGSRNADLSKIMPGEMLTVGGICTITKYLGVAVPLPKYQIDVTGDINFTGNLRKNGNVQSLTSDWSSSISSINYPLSTMFSLSSGGYTASVSSRHDVAYDAWYAFNNVIGLEGWLGAGQDYNASPYGGYTGSVSTTYDGNKTVSGEWIQLQVPTSITIGSIKIAPINGNSLYCAGDGIILGSTNGSTWTKIHSFTGQTYTDGQYTTISFSNSVAYSYFRLVVERTASNSTLYPKIYIGELKFCVSTTHVYNNNIGNIGINTSSPLYKLDVDGDINMSTGSSFRINGVAQTFGGGGSGGSSVWGVNIITNSAYYLSGNIGIGTNTPGYKLDVDGDINISSGSRFRINGVEQTFGIDSSNTFTITTANTERFRIDSSGDTTIGEDNDIGTGHRLTVVDGSTGNDGSYADLVITNMNEHNNARLLLGTPHNTDSTSGFKAAIIADGAGSYSRCDLHFCLDQSTNNTGNADLNDSKMTIKYATGDVGIGTTAPTYRLDVFGDINLSGDLRINGVAQNFVSGSSQWTLSGSNIYRPSGMVGILNTNPSYPLDVTGDINVTGDLHVTGGLHANGAAGTSGQVLTSSGGGAMSWTNKIWSYATVTSHPTVTMTSASSGGYVASASSVTNSGPAYDAFNNVIGGEGWMGGDWSYTGSPTGTYTGSFSTTYNGSTTVDGEWIQLQVPTSIVIDSIKIAPQNFRALNAPTEGKILGSTNGSTWSLIHSFTGQTYTDGQYTTISFSNSVAYSYFRLSVERTGGGSGPGPGSLRIGELKFNKAIDTYYSGNVGIGTISPAHPLDVVGNINCTGTLSKGSGSFKIDHPLANMSNTHCLYHSFIEGPQADLIYRGKVDLENGSASINLDTVSKMTSGTFEALNRNVQCFTSNESDWDAVKGSVSGNMLTISCQNASSTATVSWLVIGERKDKHMYDTSWTDDDGHVIPEQLK